MDETLPFWTAEQIQTDNGPKMQMATSYMESNTEIKTSQGMYSTTAMLLSNSKRREAAIHASSDRVLYLMSRSVISKWHQSEASCE